MKDDTDKASSKPADNNGVSGGENSQLTAAERNIAATKETLKRLDEPAAKERLRRKGWRR